MVKTIYLSADSIVEIANKKRKTVRNLIRDYLDRYDEVYIIAEHDLIRISSKDEISKVYKILFNN